MTQSDVGAAVSFVVSAGSGASSYLHIFDQLNHYAPLMGAFISGIAFITGFYFMRKASRKAILADQNKINFDNYKKESDGNFKKLDGKIQIIEEHVSKINNGIDTLINNNKKQ